MLSPKVRIVDDNESVRASESFSLSVAGFDTVAYESAEEFLKKDDLSRPGCLLLDVRMEGMSGLELQLRLKSMGIELPILFISGHADLNMAVGALKKGAVDFLEKPVPTEKLINAVEKLVKHSIVACAKKEERSRKRALFDTLTPKEQEIAKLVAQDKLNKVIAFDLNITEHTVKLHRGNLYKKLGVRTVTELFLFLREIEEINPVTEEPSFLHQSWLLSEDASS